LANYVKALSAWEQNAEAIMADRGRPWRDAPLLERGHGQGVPRLLRDGLTQQPPLGIGVDDHDAVAEDAPSREQQWWTFVDPFAPDLLDGILELYIEHHLSADEIISRGYDEAVVRWVQRRVDLNEWKRHQAAPGIRVTSKAFGMGRRMPIVQRFVG